MSESEEKVIEGHGGPVESDESLLRVFRQGSKSDGHWAVDQYGNTLEIVGEIARGGQGVVFRTSDADLAIKQPLGPNGRPNRSKNLQAVFARIRCLPLPENLPISLPVSILKSEPGYVMTLLNEMKPFSSFNINGEDRSKLREEPLPSWLESMPSRKGAEELLFYAQTGSARRRLYALYKCAAIIARLHYAGLVYGDVSPSNAYIGDGEPCDVWLIDADNLRSERVAEGPSVFSPQYGAPEVVRGEDSSRPYSDIWAFSVMAFQMLTLVHPFIGRAVLDPESDSGGWDSDDWDSPSTDSKPADLDEQAYMGYLPFIDDELDDSNEGMEGLPRELVLTPLLQRLYQETLGIGRVKYWRRSAMALWALALAQAHDHMLVCPSCGMSYYNSEPECPYCGDTLPAHFLAKTEHWSMVLQTNGLHGETILPHRLFNAFSLEHGDDLAFEASLDCERRWVKPVRGTSKFPDGITFTYVEGGRK